MRLYNSMFYTIFCAMLLITSSLCGMNERYNLIPELIAHRAINIDHNTGCALALVNTTLNTIVRFTAEQKKKYLEPHIQKQSNFLSPQSQYVTWHALGSACAFVTETERNEYQNNVNFCRLQLAGNDVTGSASISTKVHLIMECYGLYRCNDEYRVYDGCGTYDTMISLPIFDNNGNASVYRYSSLSTKNALFMETSINNIGDANWSQCMFEYRGEGYSFRLLVGTPLLRAFINSHTMQKKNYVKTFMSGGVRIDSAPLTKEDMHKIDCIIASHH